MRKYTKLSPLERRKQILDAAIQLSLESSYHCISRKAIARKLRVSESLINAYFINIEWLKECVIKEAFKQESLTILSQILVCSPKHVRKMEIALQLKIVNFIRERVRNAYHEGIWRN